MAATINFRALLANYFNSFQKSAALTALLVLGGASHALGANYTITDGADGGPGTLRAAIEAANSDPASNDVIDFSNVLAGQTINLSSMLPIINKTTGTLTITGLGADQLTISGQDAHRLFFVRSGDVTISNLTLANGTAQGGHGAGTAGNLTGVGGGGGGLGAGAAVFVDSGANVTVAGVVVQNSSATGGSGGNRLGDILGGSGGGGGLGGHGGYGSGGESAGGASRAGGGGGGGGLGGSGGHGEGSAGGGGGGFSGTGGNGGGGNGTGINSGGGGGNTGAGGAGTGTAGNGGAGDGAQWAAGGGGGGGGENGQDGQAYNAHGGTNGGGGGDGGYGGGGGGSAERTDARPGHGGDFGGGGGEAENAVLGVGGNGGFAGGGGGAGGYFGPATGGAGGFGGGGGGGKTAGEAGDYGGAGGTTGGGGGGALGGAIFVRDGGTLKLVDSDLTGSSVAAGSGAGDATAGTAKGEAIFLHNTNLNVDVTGTNTVTIENSIADNSSGVGGTASSLTKDGTGTLILEGANQYTGGTTVNAGELQGTSVSIQGDVVNNNIVNFNQDTDGTYVGDMSGTGLLSKQGTGMLTITGNHTQTLGAAVFDGGLQVNGTVVGEATVGMNAVLSGTGQVGALGLYGTLAPGASIGTLSVANDASFYSDNTTQIEVNDAGNAAGVNNDLVAVSGNADLFGGTVNVLAAPGNYTHGTQYTFLTAGSITGTFDSITDDLAFFTAQLGYTPTSVYFTLMADSTDFAAIAATPNQTAIAIYLDGNSVGASGPFQDLLDDLQLMTTGQVRAALEQMSGDVFGTTQQIGIQNTTLVLHTIAQQLQPLSFHDGGDYDYWANSDTTSQLNDAEIVQVSYQPDGTMQFNRGGVARRRTTWAMGVGIGGDADSDGNAGRLDYGMGGALVGFDTYWNCNHRIGFYGGYVGSGIDTASRGARNEINGGQVGTYITGRNGIHYYTILSGLQFDGYDSERVINSGGLNLRAQADYDGWQGFSYLERGFVLHQSHRWCAQPFAALQFVHVRQNGFTETGAGAANLSVDGLDDDSLRSILGLRAQVRTVGYKSHITPEFRAAWVHEFLDTDSPVVARFASVGGTAFIAQGLDMGRDWALVGTGLNWNLGGGWSGQANYDAQVNEHQSFHVGSGSVQKTW